MRIIDYEYIAENMSELSRIPVRVYKNQSLVKLFTPIPFFVDPAELYIDKLLAGTKTISYYITPYYHYYGIVRHNGHTLIIGPTSQLPLSRLDAREMMFLLGIEESRREQYQNMLNSITPMPLELFLHLLCMVNYYLSDEKKSISDILLFDSISGRTPQQLNEAEYDPDKHDSDLPNTHEHTSIGFETQMLSFVKNGDIDSLLSLFSHASPGRAGKVGDTYLRQLKNIFIASATLVSRAAIEGGLPAEEVLTLSDNYIRHCEKYQNPEQINNLQYNMVMDFTTQVHDLTHGKRYSKIIRDAISYIRDHLTENIRIDVLCDATYLSRSRLSVLFKEETGMTVTEYIRLLKIKKAQEYLTQTDKTPLEISTYLGFSSQNYFQNVFKEVTGMTPGEYRKK